MRKLTFEEWWAAADEACKKLCGMSLDDLPDIDFRAMYEERASPLRAARKAIKNAKEN